METTNGIEFGFEGNRGVSGGSIDFGGEGGIRYAGDRRTGSGIDFAGDRSNEVGSDQSGGDGDGVGIGINGLGRIGRLVLRAMLEAPASERTTIRAVNATVPAETIAHLLKYDSVHGRFRGDVRTDAGDLIVNGRRIAVTVERDPSRLRWAERGVDLVIDASGQFNYRAGAELHRKAGARKVIVTAPGKEMDVTIVRGVNEERYDPETHHLLSAASCTTNCVAPILHRLDRAFGVESGWVTAVHAYTNDQKHLDNPHADLRRARACTQSIVPTTTGIGKALKDVLPHLADRIQGLSLRVPVPDVSLADMTLTLRRDVRDTDVREALAPAGGAGVVHWTDEPLVSVDFIGNPYSATVDGRSLAANGRQLKLLAWYDNEWGYACRVAETAELVARSIKSEMKAGRSV